MNRTAAVKIFALPVALLYNEINLELLFVLLGAAFLAEETGDGKYPRGGR